jgi:TRAP-type mannitol/chloroaromatic compound transport system permease small subunit
MRTISDVMTILTIIVASPLGPCSQLVLLVSFDKLLLAHHFGESSYEESHLIRIILGALITIIIFFFLT